MQKTFLKYTIIKVRQKISYEAFIKKHTVVELFCHKILLTYKLTKNKNYVDHSLKVMEYMDEFTKTSSLNNCFMLLIKLNAARGDFEI